MPASNKCDLGFRFCPDGVHELDPCLYEEIETHTNVTVHVMRCKKCGHIEISWERQDETEDIQQEVSET